VDVLLAILTIVAWPVVGLVLGIVGILILKKPLIRAVDRVKKIGPTELSTEQVIQESAKDLRPTPSDEALKVFDNRLLVAREDAVRKDLDGRGISTSIERERVLLRHFSAISVCFQFERTYNQIWGSQIAALQLLNTRGDHGCEQSELLAFYSDAKNIFQHLYANYPFESWLKFMESFALIKVASDKISITLEGREFLKYLLDQSYFFQKPG
jgi:hypothetical protein